MLRWGLLLGCALVAACDSGTPKPAASPPVPTAPLPPPQVDAGPVSEAVPFNCKPFRPAWGAGCNVRPDIPREADALHSTGAQILAWEASHRPPDERWNILRTALAGAFALDPTKLTLDVRIVLQNNALMIAVYATTQTPALAKLGLDVVTKLAPTAKELASLPGEPRLGGWVSGPWQHRDRRNQMQLHGMLHQRAKYFRPVLASDGRRAVFSQLFAIDTAGTIHLTPIVGEVELRASSDDDSPACVVEVKLVDLACAPPGLVEASLVDHPTSHFFRRTGDTTIACNGCHTSSTFPIVADADVATLVAGEIKAATDELAAQIAAVKAAAVR